MFADRQVFASFSVDDIDAARAFYDNTLGLIVTHNEMGFLELHPSGGGRVLIYPKDSHQPATFTVLNIVVGDVEAAVDGLVAAGVTFERYEGFSQDERGIARDGGGGGAIAWFKDPAGNVLAVLSEG